MRALILDYGGTLDLVDDPTDFVQQLVGQGDFVVLYTGDPENADSAAGSRCHVQFLKGEDKPFELAGAIMEFTGGDVQEIVVVDDDPELLRLWERQAQKISDTFGLTVSGLPAEHIEDLLT